MLSWALSPVGGEDASELSPGKQVLPGKMNKGPDVRKGKLTPTRRCNVSERQSQLSCWDTMGPNSQGTARSSDWVTQHPPVSLLPCVGQTGSSALVLHQLESTGCATPVLSCIRTLGHENPAVM